MYACYTWVILFNAAAGEEMQARIMTPVADGKGYSWPVHC